MRLSAPRRRPRAESIVPMINVVFLLLIFFLMTAELRPAPPFEVALPAAGADPAGASAALFASADGRLAFGAARGEAALAAAAAAAAGGPVLLRADRDLPGGDLARLVARLAAAGATEVRLAVEGG